MIFNLLNVIRTSAELVYEFMYFEFYEIKLQIDQFPEIKAYRELKAYVFEK